MTPSNSTDPKIERGRWNQHAIIFYRDRVSQFCPKIHCHGNRGCSR